MIHSAAVAFGFVFIHPFMDGNGRLHRYLIHEELSVLGFTPKGIALPVSAFILANVDRYIEVLEQFSRPRTLRTESSRNCPTFPHVATMRCTSDSSTRRRRRYSCIERLNAQ